MCRRMHAMLPRSSRQKIRKASPILTEGATAEAEDCGGCSLIVTTAVALSSQCGPISPMPAVLYKNQRLMKVRTSERGDQPDGQPGAGE